MSGSAGRGGGGDFFSAVAERISRSNNREIFGGEGAHVCFKVCA